MARISAHGYVGTIIQVRLRLDMEIESMFYFCTLKLIYVQQYNNWIGFYYFIAIRQRETEKVLSYLKSKNKVESAI